MAEVLARAYITVARVYDGTDGADAIHLALDQVVGSVPCDLLLQTSSPSNILYTTLTLYQGGKEIDMPAPTITLTSPHTGVVLDSTPGKSRRYKITVYDDAGLSETVTFKVVYQNVEYSAVFTVTTEAAGMYDVYYYADESSTASSADVKFLNAGGVAGGEAYVTTLDLSSKGGYVFIGRYNITAPDGSGIATITVTPNDGTLSLGKIKAIEAK